MNKFKDGYELILNATPLMVSGALEGQSDEPEDFLDNVEDDLFLQEHIASTSVSEKIANECKEELDNACRTGWHVDI